MISRYETFKKHSEIYCDLLKTANEMYLKGGISLQEGLALYNDNLPNIRKGQSWASNNTKNNSDAAALAVKYYLVGFYILIMRMTYQEHLDWLKDGLRAANKNKDKVGKVKILGYLGTLYKNLLDYKNANYYSKAQFRLAVSLKDKTNQAIALNTLGLLSNRAGRYSQCIKYLERSLALAKEVKMKRNIGIAYGNLGIPYIKKGNFDEGIKYYRIALNFARRVGDRRAIGSNFGNIGCALRDRKEYYKAIGYFRKQLLITRELEDTANEARCLLEFAKTYMEISKYSLAKSYASDSLVIDKNLNPEVLKEAEELIKTIEDKIVSLKK